MSLVVTEGQSLTVTGNLVGANVLATNETRLSTIEDKAIFNQVNVKDYGAVDDKATDNTDLVLEKINDVYDNGGGIVTIPYGVVWDYSSIDNAYSGTATGGSSTTLVDSGANWDTNELKGGFLWNTTDKSYGLITGNTSDTVTVSRFLLGSDNSFEASDTYKISKHKANVIIDDQSTYDFYDSAFTAQVKTIVCMPEPSAAAANELHFSAPYHPAIIIGNSGPGGMENRASLIFRHYKDGSLYKWFQTGINGSSGSMDQAESQYMIVGGNATAYSELLGLRYTDIHHREMGLGIRAQAGYSLYIKHWEDTENCKVAINSPSDAEIEILREGTSKHKIVFDSDNQYIYLYAGDTQIGRITSNGSLDGFRNMVTDFTDNYSLAQNQSGRICTNSGATGTINIYLPTITSGLGVQFTFVVLASQNLVIKPYSGQRIFGTSDIDKGVYASVIGNTITFMCVGSSWYVKSSVGTWTYL